jgi:hypothetical protein
MIVAIVAVMIGVPCGRTVVVAAIACRRTISIASA